MAIPRPDEIVDWAQRHAADPRYAYAYAAANGQLPAGDPIAWGRWLQENLGGPAQDLGVTAPLVASYITATGRRPQYVQDIQTFLVSYGGSDDLGEFNGRLPPLGWNYRGGGVPNMGGPGTPGTSVVPTAGGGSAVATPTIGGGDLLDTLGSLPMPVKVGAAALGVLLLTGGRIGRLRIL